jgi:hypothetical protein
MNRKQYIDALTFCFQAETMGSIAGEVAMLVRSDAKEKRKLDVFRRLEASNKLACLRALQKEGLLRPLLGGSYYRFAYKLGLRLGEGDWPSFLDRFSATIHPEVFEKYLAQAAENAHEGDDGVDKRLFERLVRHEHALMRFVSLEREGRGDDSTAEMESLLGSKLCEGLVAADDPVGW